MTFINRIDAGKQLATALEKYKNGDVIVYALPRGGVVLGAEIANSLNAPLDLIITRKIGHPSSPEYAIGVVAEDGDSLFNEAEKAAVDAEWLKKEIAKEQNEAKRRRELYLKNQQKPNSKDKIAILVDDGVATGLTFLLSLKELKHLNPKKIVAAIPVAPRDTLEKIKKEADEVIVLDTPFFYLGSVGAYYKEFEQVEDEEVIQILDNLKSQK